MIALLLIPPIDGLKFMGKDWDHGVPGEAFWKEALRVAKPGAILMAFGGTRTHHRLMVAVEDAGWILRDTIMWVYGSGFPKSHAIGKAIDKAAGMEREVIGHKGGRYDYAFSATTGAPLGNISPRENSPQNMEASGYITAPATDLARIWDGWGTALKPAWEPVIVAMAPLDGTFAQNAEKWGVAGLWIDGCRVPANDNVTRDRDTSDGASIFGTGKGGGAVVPVASGRFPANLIHDGSDEVVGLFPANAPSGGRKAGQSWVRKGRIIYDEKTAPNSIVRRDYISDSGSAARFFKTCPPDARRIVYQSKASRKERNAGCAEMPLMEPPGSKRSNPAPGRESALGKPRQNGHPCVKPLALMEYLCKLTRTPTGGVVLDPFMGSGTTGIACVNTDRDFIGIEIDADYFAIAEARIAHAQAQPAQMQMEDMA